MSEPMMQEILGLKNCPFCGGKPADISPTEFDDYFLIECVDCAASVIFDSRPGAVYRVWNHDEAIAAWNRRVSEPVEEGPTDDVRGLLDEMFVFYSQHETLKIPFSMSGRGVLQMLRDGQPFSTWNESSFAAPTPTTATVRSAPIGETLPTLQSVIEERDRLYDECAEQIRKVAALERDLLAAQDYAAALRTANQSYESRQ